MKTTFMRITSTALASIAIVTSLGVASFAAESQRNTEYDDQGYYKDVVTSYGDNWEYDTDANKFQIDWEAFDNSVFYLR